MSPSSELTPAERFQRLEELFLEASEMQPIERRDFLQEACGEDEGLLADVERLLGLETTAEAQIDGAVVGMAKSLAQPLADRVGPYRILEPLGQGGLGTVLLAERDDGHFHKRVALKVVRSEMWSPELEERLRQERQILAGLDHPNIARILDGGTTEDGGAYIVMELVESPQTLVEYCLVNQLDIERRLQLFRSVCDAVQHAHQRLILHCDIKPSNILVGADGVPKLLDFGIAKALQESLPGAGDAPLTIAGRRPLTPEYASPEQVRYQPLTTASDIYSLGVVLFELLSGSRPYRIESSDPLAIARVVSESEAPTASRRYRERHKIPTGASPWGRDLDAIVAQTLRKDPSRRYGSAEQLSDDLRRYLEHLPVRAQMDTYVYRLRKLIRRNPVLVALVSALITTLIVATVTTSFQARRAETEKERAEEVVELLVGLFEGSDPALSKGSEISAREVLDQGSRSLQYRLEDRPRLRAALTGTIGRVYRELGIYDKAELHLNESLDLRRQSFSASSPEIVQSRYQFALLRIEELRFDDAELLLQDAMDAEARRRGRSTPTYAQLLKATALCRLERGRPAEADALLEEALGIMKSDSKTLDHADLWDLAARSAYAQGKFGQAVVLNELSLNTRRKILGDPHPLIATSLNNLAAARQAHGEIEDARPLLQEALDMRIQLYGRRHGAVALALHNLATTDLARGDLGTAEEQLREALDILREIHGPEHVTVADTLYVLALIESETDAESAADLHRQALAIRLEELGKEHPDTAQSYLGLGDALLDVDPEATRHAYEQALDLQRRYLPATDFRLAFTLERLGNLHCRGTPVDGASFYREAFEIRRNELGEDHWQTALSRARWGRCLISIDPALAAEHLHAAHAALDSSLGTEDPRTLKVADLLAGLNGNRPSPP